MMNKYFAAWLCLLLALSTFVMTADVSDTAEGKESAVNGTTYIASAPFRINSNADFATSPKVTGGDGSAGNPWVIENFEINGTGYGSCIYIGNITDYFVIRNCYLHEASGSLSNIFSYRANSGIYFFHVTNGAIINNTIISNDQYGMLLFWDCYSNVIADNNISYNSIGVYQWQSWTGNTFSNNTFFDNNYGIRLYYAQSDTYSDNLFLNNAYDIQLEASTDLTLVNNEMIGNGIFIDGGETAWESHSIDTTNTVNGKPVRYYANQNSITVPTDAGQIIFAKCTLSVIENQNLSNVSAGISLGYSTNITIRNNNLSSCIYGIYLQGSDYNDIINNTVSKNENGIALAQSEFNCLAGNIALYNNNSGIGFLDLNENHYNNTIVNNTLHNNFNAIDLLHCCNASVMNNTAFNNTNCGISISASYNNAILQNNVTWNGWGIVINGINNLVKNNNASNNAWSGITLSGGNDNILWNNTVYNNSYSGIQISSKYSNNVENNTAIGNPVGFLLKGSQFALVKNNKVLDNHLGFSLTGSINNRIFGNTVDNSIFGMFLDSSSNNYIGENSILNSTGMTGSSTYSSLETDLDVYQNDVNWSNYTTFEEQLATGDGGNPLFTRAVDLVDTLIFEVGVIGHANAYDLDLGIFLDGKGGNPIDGITQTGEFVTMCADNDADESIRLSVVEDGTYLIRVFGFTLGTNPAQFDMQMHIVNGTSTGIYLMNSTYNRIVNNNISDNAQGLNLTQASNFNLLHYNNIAGNTVQAFDDGYNLWNASYPTGGNFWSDYTGVDSFSGPNQNVAGSDGIGDTPYSLILGDANEDVYPLMDYTDGIYLDVTPPTSSAFVTRETIFHELDWGSCDITAIVTDDYSGIANIALWYRHSLDNVSWDSWTEYMRVDGITTWFFDPVFITMTGEGHYQFYSIAADCAGNIETKAQAAEAYWVFDLTAPQSEIFQPPSYWNIPDLDMQVNVTDNTNSTSNVEVLYRFSSDNATWDGWTSFDNITAEPWNFTFDFPDGQGCYQFYSRANDTSGNLENATAGAQAMIGYDVDAPLLTDNTPAVGTTGDAFSFNVNATDNVALAQVNIIYSFSTGNETNATMVPGTGDSFALGTTISLGSLDVLHYRIVAVDSAGNWNSTGTKNVIISDNDNPVADAGPDQTAEVYGIVTFNGSSSTDNIGIINFTWAFNDGIANITLYGVMPNHTFAINGSFAVTLTVKDAAGNSGTDTMLVTVTGQAPVVDDVPPIADAGSDRSVVTGAEVSFDGSSSTDNVGIANYTWAFTHNGTAIILYGVSPSFKFWEVGNHTVTLNVTDTAGNWDTDTMNIEVLGISPEADEPGNYTWLIAIAIIILVVVVLLVWLLKRGKPETSEQTAEPVQEPPKPQPEAKPKLDKDEMVRRIEKAYKEGKMTEEQYRKNIEKFK